MIKKIVKMCQDKLFFVYVAIYKNRNINKDKVNKATIIICNDHIGDTIVRMNCLTNLVNYFGKQNTFIVTSPMNEAVVKLITEKTIIFDPIKFARNLLYKLKFFKSLNMLDGYNIVSLVPYKRHQSNMIADLIIGEKKVWLNQDDGGCDYVLEPLTKVFNQVTNYEMVDTNLEIDLRKNTILENVDLYNFNLPHKYVVCSMGADSYQRMYSPKEFSKVIEYMLQKNRIIVFLGKGHKDLEFFDKMEKKITNHKNIINFINKTTLNETLAIIRDSDLFIGVESGMWNCAYTLKVPSIVIYGGGHYGRFMHKDPTITYVYEKELCFNCNWQCKYNINSFEPAPCIGNIKSEHIICAIKNKGV